VTLSSSVSLSLALSPPIWVEGVSMSDDSQDFSGINVVCGGRAGDAVRWTSDSVLPDARVPNFLIISLPLPFSRR
jgi:hypothetical protein